MVATSASHRLVDARKLNWALLDTLTPTQFGKSLNDYSRSARKLVKNADSAGYTSL